MTIFELITDYGAFIASIVLAIITFYYAILTRKMLKITKNQQNISLNPVIGIKVKKIIVGKEFGPQRRNLGVHIELTNVGNAPAVEVIVDSEIELRYSPIKNEYCIPSRFEPNTIPFIKQNETISDVHLSYGNDFIVHFFADVRESHRLNLHRIATDATQKAHKTSRLYVNVYYKNSMGQYFYSRYEIEITICDIVDSRDEKAINKDPIPLSNETKTISMTYIPRPVFRAGIITEKEVKDKIENNNNKRDLCGW